MPLIDVEGTGLDHDVEGSGEPLVLVHGSWGSRLTWRFLAPLLAESFRVVTYSRRGHGNSGGSPEAGTVHDDVADLAGLIEALDLAPTHVLGTSYGAIVSLRLAGRRPDLVARLMCHEPPLLGLLDADPETKGLAREQWGHFAEVRRQLEDGDHAGGARYFVEHVAGGPGTWEQLPAPVRDLFVAEAPTFLGELRDPDAFLPDADRLDELPMPVLLTNGDRSPPMFAAVVAALEQRAPGFARHTFVGAGHVPHTTHPADEAAVARRFLTGAG